MVLILMLPLITNDIKHIVGIFGHLCNFICEAPFRSFSYLKLLCLSYLVVKFLYILKQVLYVIYVLLIFLPVYEILFS